MKRSIIFFITVVIMHNVAFSQNDCDACKTLKNNVVKITSTFSDGHDENGFGTIVGENGNKLLVLTAKHIIYTLNSAGYRDSKPKHVNVRFYTDQGTDYTPTLLKLSDNRFDITLIEVTKPPSFTWTKDFYSDSFQAGTKVWFIGREGKWYTPLGNSIGEINDVTIDDEISIDINSVLPGTSGAPLISKGGMVGVIFEDGSTGAKAYPIDKIKQIMAHWNYQYEMNLKPRRPEPHTKQLGPVERQQKGISPPKIPFYFSSENDRFFAIVGSFKGYYQVYQDSLKVFIQQGTIHYRTKNELPTLKYDGMTNIEKVIFRLEKFDKKFTFVSSNSPFIVDKQLESGQIVNFKDFICVISTFGISDLPNYKLGAEIWSKSLNEDYPEVFSLVHSPGTMDH